MQSAIKDTETKLTDLKNAYKVAEEQAEKGDLGQKELRVLAREVIETESKLETLNNQLKQTNKDANFAKSGLKSFSDSAKSAGDKLSGVSKGATAMLTALVGTVPATQELRRDLSNLEQNAEASGVGMDKTTEAFKAFNAVSGETDSSVEATSNLLQAGFTKSNLQTAVEGLSGAYQRFPDTLKIESLADSLQETLATGKATGQFGELLDRLGIGADNFSNELAKCTTEAEKQDLALKTLADAGLNDTYKAWQENNKEMIDYENAMFDLQQALTDLGTSVAPVVSEFAELGSKGLNAFNKLPKPIKTVSLALTGLTAVSSPVLKGIGSITEVVGKFNKTSGLAKTTTSLLSKTIGSIPTPVTLAVGAFTALAGGIKLAYDEINKEKIAVQNFIEEQKNSLSAYQEQSAVLDVYASKVRQLADVENKSTQQKEQLKNYVDMLNQSVDGLNLKYDEETDKLNKTTDEIYKQIEAQKQKLKTDAYLKQASAYADEYYQSQQKIAEAQANLSLAEDKYNSLIEKRNQLHAQGKELSSEELKRLGELPREIGKYESEVEKLTEAQQELAPEMVKTNNALAMQDGTFDSLAKSAAKDGVKITENLKNAFITGQYEIPATVEELKQLIKFDDLSQKAGVAGQDTVTTLQTQLLNGEITIDQAIQTLTTSMGTELDKGKTISQQAGTETGQGYASGISSQNQNTKTAGKSLAQSGKSGAGSVSYKSVGTGAGGQIKSGINSSSRGVSTSAKKMMTNSKNKADDVNWEPVGEGVVSGTKAGIDNNKSDAISAAANMAFSALARAKERLGINSPSKEFAKLGKYVDEGFALGINNNLKEVEKASNNLANASLIDTSNSILNAKDVLQNDIVKHEITERFDYSKMYAVMDSALQSMNLKIVMDNREVGRALRGMGVDFS